MKNDRKLRKWSEKKLFKWLKKWKLWIWNERKDWWINWKIKFYFKLLNV